MFFVFFYKRCRAPVLGIQVQFLILFCVCCRYGQSEVTGGCYSNRRRQEEEEEREEEEEEVREEEDGQEMETEESTEIRKRQLKCFPSASFYTHMFSAQDANDVSELCLSHCRCESVR